MSTRVVSLYKRAFFYGADVWGLVFLNMKYVRLSRKFVIKPRGSRNLGSFKNLRLRVARPIYYYKPRTLFGKVLRDKQRLSMFYGVVPNKKLKRLFTEGYNKSTFVQGLLYNLEMNFGVILYRLGLSSTVRSSMRSFGLKDFSGEIISYNIKSLMPIGQLVSGLPLSLVARAFMYYYFGFLLYPYPSSYIEFSYRTLGIVLFRIPELYELSYPFIMKKQGRLNHVTRFRFARFLRYFTRWKV